MPELITDASSAPRPPWHAGGSGVGASGGSPVPPVLLATAAMGTRFELVLAGADERRLRSAGEEALAEIEHAHRLLSRFETGSDVWRLNRDAQARVHPLTSGLLELCEQLRIETGGAFDVRVGRMMEEAGLHPAGTGEIDLGAIGKGWALDRAAEVLRERGVESALLHGGTSSVVAMGEWPVRVRSEGRPLEVVLSDEALGVSAPRGRVSTRGGGGHVLDPRTGRSAADADTAAVRGPTAAVCDAWSTALIVNGRLADSLPRGYSAFLHGGRGWQGSAGTGLQKHDT